MTYAAAALGINVDMFPIISGGTLSSDATYYYRTFTANGTLSVSKLAINADVLIVAGGAGGGQNFGGGGGAGGLVLSSQSNLLGSLDIVVGGGGTSGSGLGGNGNPSSFSSITASGGGGGGAGNVTVNGSLEKGVNGASGGGGASNSIVDVFSLGGTASPSGQGNAGGRGYRATQPVLTGIGSGGGGGAGAAGSDWPSMNGGIGSNSYSTWASATSTGDRGYYAGGGSGSGGYQSNTEIQPTQAYTLGGGGYTTGFDTSRPGLVNTGGGGSSGVSATPGIGGSGIVIVRYLRSAVGG